MQINGAFSVHGAQSIKPSAKSTVTESTNRTEQNIFQPTDEVDFSADVNWVNHVNELPDVRTDRVNEIRAQIQAGTYETEAKLDIALDRLLDEIS